MNSSNNIPIKDLVLIGGGHAHVHVMKMLGMNPIPHLRVILVSRDIESPYSGMIPGFLAGYYTHEECHIDIHKLATFANIRFIHAEVIHIDVLEREVFFRDESRPPIHYDLLSVDIGIIPKPLPLSISERMTLTSQDLSITPVKPIDRFAWRWEQILHRFSQLISSDVRQSQPRSPLRLVVVGGGAGGVELSFAIRHRFKEVVKASLGSEVKVDDVIRVVLLNKSDAIMKKHARLVSDLVQKMLGQRGVEFHNSANIVDVALEEEEGGVVKRSLIAEDGRRFAYDEAIWCTEAMGQSWLRGTGLALDDDGCILVNSTLESINTRHVFAAGDICHNIKHPRPKAGVFAVRAGPPLLQNIKHALFGEELEEWVPQDEFLGLIGTGDGHCIASKGGMALEGEHLWQLKDKIDRQWMRGYQQLPSMEEMEEKRRQTASPSQPLSSSSSSSSSLSKNIADLLQPDVIKLLQKSKMRCAGCGSKVGSSVISRAFRRLAALEKKNKEVPMSIYRPEVIAGIGDDAAVMRMADPSKLLVQTIDYFRSFVADPFLFGQIAANHALSDVFAMNGEAVTAMALCVLPYAPERKVEDDLVQMLAGMKSMLFKEKCALVGGHTSEGSEPALGLAVTGLVSPSQVFHKGPILHRGGAHLLLTKPIGTGTVLAAQMRGEGVVKGRWMSACYEMMLTSNSKAASLLSQHSSEVVACTDVTGFGLLGHLVEMIRHERDLDLDSEEEEVVVRGGEGGRRKVRRVVSLDLARIPVLPGARECSEVGVVSSLFGQNARAQQFIERDHIAAFEGHEVYRLLFDPQTSGGLLAVVLAEESQSLVERLREAGYPQAAVIGHIEDIEEEDEDEKEEVEEEGEEEEFKYLIHLTDSSSDTQTAAR